MRKLLPVLWEVKRVSCVSWLADKKKKSRCFPNWSSPITNLASSSTSVLTVEQWQVYSAEMGHIPGLSYRMCAQILKTGITFSGKWRWEGHGRYGLLLEALNKGHEKWYLLLSHLMKVSLSDFFHVTPISSSNLCFKLIEFLIPACKRCCCYTSSMTPFCQ